MTDGVRIPAANHFRALKEMGEVDLLIMQRVDLPRPDEDIEETREAVSRCGIIEVRRDSNVAAIAGEFLRRQPFYGALQLIGELPSWLSETEYDVVWCGTAPAVAAFARSEWRRRVKARHWVAGLSDVHSLVIYRQGQQTSKSKSRAYKLTMSAVSAGRSKVLARAEIAMLGAYDLVTMQTDKELEWIKRFSGEALVKRILLLPNGIPSHLLDLPLSGREPKVVFVGRLSAMYGHRLRWFLDDVWPLVMAKMPTAKLVVVGKGAGKGLTEIFERLGVTYQPFVPEIEDIYRDKAMLIAPIFKGFGLINKVVEAMAAGCLVLGDKTAFNGIPDFQAGVHGRVVEDAEAFAAQIVEVLGDSDFVQQQREAGRELVRRHFDWAVRRRVLQEHVRALDTEAKG